MNSTFYYFIYVVFTQYLHIVPTPQTPQDFLFASPIIDGNRNAPNCPSIDLRWVPPPLYPTDYIKSQPCKII